MKINDYFSRNEDVSSEMVSSFADVANSLMIVHSGGKYHILIGEYLVKFGSKGFSFDINELCSAMSKAGKEILCSEINELFTIFSREVEFKALEIGLEKTFTEKELKEAVIKYENVSHDIVEIHDRLGMYSFQYTRLYLDLNDGALNKQVDYLKDNKTGEYEFMLDDAIKFIYEKNLDCQLSKRTGSDKKSDAMKNFSLMKESIELEYSCPECIKISLNFDDDGLECSSTVELNDEKISTEKMKVPELLTLVGRIAKKLASSYPHGNFTNHTPVASDHRGCRTIDLEKSDSSDDIKTVKHSLSSPRF